jgi:hypothetical protein
MGVPKAGTTWLDRQLRAHPDLWLPPEKELHYFNWKVDRMAPGAWGLLRQRLRDDNWRRRLRIRAGEYRRKPSPKYIGWDLRYFFGRPDDRWYAALFAPGHGRVRGEITPDYVVLSRERIAHVHDLMPQAKLFFCVRNPIERAWSHAVMDKPDRLVEHVDGERSRARTDYTGALDRWTSAYPPDRVLVIFIEDIHFRPAELLERVHAFLGVRHVPPAKDPARRIHTGGAETIPLAMAKHLAELHGDQIRAAAARLGGYAEWWAYTADRVREEPGEADLAYPFHEGPYWEDWARSGTPELQSNRLSELGRRPAYAVEGRVT